MKLFKYLLFVSFIFSSFNLTAQDKYAVLERQLNISILYPGVSAELPLSDYFSIVPKVGLGFSFEGYVSNVGSQFNYLVAPAANLQGRFYYAGLKNETKRGNALFRNSGNYGFLQVSGNLPSIASSFGDIDAGVSVGIGWGLQRIYQNNILLSWGLGVGYDSWIQSGNWIGEFTLGYVIRPKTKEEILDF